LLKLISFHNKTDLNHLKTESLFLNDCYFVQNFSKNPDYAI